MDLSDIDRGPFEKVRNKRTNKFYLRMEYEVRISFDYPRITYEIIIPRTGKFPDAVSWGDDPIRKPAFLNCAGAIEVTKPVSLETPVRRRLGSFSPASGTKVVGLKGSPSPYLHPADDALTQQQLDSSTLPKACRRCRQIRAKCVRKASELPCYKCVRAGVKCMNRF